MKLKTIRLGLAMVFFALLLPTSSCKKEASLNENETKTENNKEISNPVDGLMAFGKVVNDPYRFENMQTALANLQGEMSRSSLQPNYRYVRVLPQDGAQLDIIEADTNLVLWDYPLHYEMTQNGDCYHDPESPDTLLTWLYTVVPTDYRFPDGISEELIYNVYIPDTEAKGADFASDLEREAFRITGHEDDLSVTRGSSWTPSATIKAFDDIANCPIPLQGVKVRARYLTKTATGTTNKNGFCQLNKTFTGKVNYSIIWESAYWDIRSAFIGQAYYNGPKQKGAWNLEIAKNGKSILYASVHRGAYKFYYGNCLGLQRPILSVGKTKIAVYDRNASWGTGCCWGTWSFMGILPDIQIAHPHEKYTSDVIGTTIHELAHQAHLIFIGKPTYIQLAKEIHESWATAVEWNLTTDLYRNDLGYTPYSYHIHKQAWYPKNKKNGKTDCYTPLFIDLMDDFNQRTHYGNTYPNDLISGYTIDYIQNNILINSYGLSSFCSALKTHKTNGVTDAQIDQLLALYWNQTYTR